MKPKSTPPALRPRLRIFVAVLLLTTFALTLHLQAARYQQPFPARHILHGDLRHDSEKPVQVIPPVGCPTTLLMATGLYFATSSFFVSPPRVVAIDHSRLSLLRYCARLFRAPPPVLSSIR
jgi:hypothetical protein